MKLLHYIIVTHVYLLPYVGFGALPTIDVGQIANSLTMIKDSAKYHTETVLKWKKNFELVSTQIDQIDKLKSSLGNTKELAADIGWDWWHDRDIDIFHEQQYLFKKLRYDADGLASTAYTGKGLYKKLRQEDQEGNKIPRNVDDYKRHNLVEQQYESFHDVNEATAEIKKGLHEEALQVIGKLKNASTDAEVQLLNAKITSINGQLDLLQNLRQDEINRLQAQAILNENQREKEKRAAQENFLHDQNSLTNKTINFFKTIKLKEEA